MSPSSLLSLAYAVALPGFLALGGFAVEFVDRKLYARFQHRVGPPWYQPVADSVNEYEKRP